MAPDISTPQKVSSPPASTTAGAARRNASSTIVARVCVRHDIVVREAAVSFAADAASEPNPAKVLPVERIDPERRQWCRNHGTTPHCGRGSHVL